MSRRNSRTAHDLLAQLNALLSPAAQLIHAHEREWASITFAGSRHRLIFEIAEQDIASAAVQAALSALPEHEFTLRGEIVADCTATIGLPQPTPMPTAAASNKHAGVRLLVVELLTVVSD